jgi:uracil DNA glycosylase
MDLEEIIEKLQDKVRTTSWYTVLRWFLMSNDFKKIIIELFEFIKQERRFTPGVKDLFTSFVISDYTKLKVVFLFDSPYKKVGWSNGTPIACPNTVKKTSEFKYFENAVGKKLKRDMSNFAKGEVLLLNSCLTTDIHKKGSLLHYQIWKPFIIYLLDKLSNEKKYIFVFVGKKTKEYAYLVDDSNPKFYLDDIPTTFDFSIDWDYKNIFNEIDKLLVKNNQLPIKW